MIHNLLCEYRGYLETKYSKETARTYTDRLGVLFEGQNLTDTIHKFDVDKILIKLSGIKYKNHFSQSKNALLHFCEFQNISINNEVLEKMNSIELGTHKKYRQLREVDYKEIEKKIKYIRNKKLKLSYQTLIETGLRVSELAQISPADCVISDNEITFNFLAKGGEREEVIINSIENPVLFQRLREHIGSTKPENKVFYSAIYLQTKAHEMGFTCHDLRRACAKLEYRKTKSKEAVKEKLRHKGAKNTNIYLKSKVKI